MSEITKLNLSDLVTNIKSKKIDVSNKEWIIYDAEVYTQNFKETKKTMKINTNFNYEISEGPLNKLAKFFKLKK